MCIMLQGFYVQTYFKMFLILIHFNSDWNRKSIFCVLIRDYLGHYSYFDEFQTNFNINTPQECFVVPRIIQSLKKLENITNIELTSRDNKIRPCATYRIF